MNVPIFGTCAFNESTSYSLSVRSWFKGWSSLKIFVTRTISKISPNAETPPTIKVNTSNISKTIPSTDVNKRLLIVYSSLEPGFQNGICDRFHAGVSCSPWKSTHLHFGAEIAKQSDKRNLEQSGLTWVGQLCSFFLWRCHLLHPVPRPPSNRMPAFIS